MSVSLLKIKVIGPHLHCTYQGKDVCFVCWWLPELSGPAQIVSSGTFPSRPAVCPVIALLLQHRCSEISCSKFCFVCFGKDVGSYLSCGVWVICGIVVTDVLDTNFLAITQKSILLNNDAFNGVGAIHLLWHFFLPHLSDAALGQVVQKKPAGLAFLAV